jgi:hypothetical protein
MELKKEDIRTMVTAICSSLPHFSTIGKWNTTNGTQARLTENLLPGQGSVFSPFKNCRQRAQGSGQSPG